MSYVFSAWVFGFFTFFLQTQLGKHFFFDFSKIYGIRIDYLAPALYLTDILILILVILGRSTILTFVKKNHKILTLMFMYSIPAIVFTEHPLLAAYGCIKLIESLCVFILVSRFFKSKRLRNSTIKVLVFSTLIQLGLALAQLIHRGAIEGVFYFLGERSLSISTPNVAKAMLNGSSFLRPYGTFSHPNSMGGFFALILAWQLSRKSSLERNTLIILSLGIVLLSFSKVAIISSALCIVYFGISRNKLSCIPCTVAKTFIGAAILIPFLSIQSDVYSLSKRVLLLNQSWSILFGNLKTALFGTGFNHHLYAHATFPQEYRYFFLQPVHNVFMLFIMQSGVILSGIVLGALIVSYKRISNLHKYALIPVMIVFLITGTFDHYWLTSQQNILLLAYLLGAVYGEFGGRPISQADN